MKHVVPAVVLSMLAGSAMHDRAWAASDAAVSGVVRDTHGNPQAGALVELLRSDAAIMAQAITDGHGRYRLLSVAPGTYQLRVSAALLNPTIRPNLHLRAGARVAADLTMAALLQAGSWLPAQKRPAAEPVDDWRWALRSTTNRPLLRLVQDGTIDSSGSVSSSSEAHRRGPVSQGQLSVLSGDGAFGDGGTHQVITLDRAGADGDVSVLRANLGDNAASTAGGSVTFAAGLQRERLWGGGTRMVVAYGSHPEVRTPTGAGLQVLRTATTEKVVLGDAIVIDAGTLFTAERLLDSAMTSAPFVRVAYRPSSALVIEYRLATDRALQSSEELDDIALPEEALSDANGRPILHHGSHQELVLSRQSGKSGLAFAIFRDSLPVQSVQGGGPVSAQDVSGLPVVTDPVTGTMRLALRGIQGQGIHIAWNQEFNTAVAACVEADAGPALEAADAKMALADVPGMVHARMQEALVGSLKLTSRRSGTKIDVHYRWQPTQTLTQVDAFDAIPQSAYLGVGVRQKLWAGRRLRQVSGVLDATNLLAEGYRPLLVEDGRALFLAQMPRAIQAGLAFSF